MDAETQGVYKSTACAIGLRAWLGVASVALGIHWEPVLDSLANTIATCVSAIAACISTYLAARAIRDSRETRRAELEAARPYFIFSNFGLRRPTVAGALSSDKVIQDPRLARIEGLLSNDGRRAATDVIGLIFVIPVGSGRRTEVFPIEIEDDVAPKSEWHVSTAPLEIVPNNFPGIEQAPNYSDPGFFVLTCVSYMDPISMKRHVQNSFMRWPGISNGVIAGNLYAAERKDKDALLSLHAEFLRPYIENGLIALKEH